MLVVCGPARAVPNNRVSGDVAAWWSLWHKGPCAPPARWAGSCPAKGFLPAMAFYKAGSFSLLGSAKTYQVSSTLLSSVMLPSGVFGGFWHVIKQIKKWDETVPV